ncbi:hypothetical protein Tco_0515165 [Tanacetum coccineum]
MFDIFKSIEEKVKKQSQIDKKFQNEIDRLLKTSLTRDIRDCVLLSVEKQNNEMLILEIEKISSDSKDIQATMDKRIKILENDFTQYFQLDLKMQHQKEKMSCDVSWKSKLIDENVLLKNQVESIVQERENIKNQDLLFVISKLKEKLDKQAKNVNTKFDKSTTLEKLVCVTPLNKNKDVKAKTVSKVEIKTNRSKPVTSCSTTKNGQTQKRNINVIARGMYRITKTETNLPTDKANKFSCNSTGVASSSSSNSVSRLKI